MARCPAMVGGYRCGLDAGHKDPCRVERQAGATGPVRASSAEELTRLCERGLLLASTLRVSADEASTLTRDPAVHLAVPFVRDVAELLHALSLEAAFRGVASEGAKEREALAETARQVPVVSPLDRARVAEMADLEMGAVTGGKALAPRVAEAVAIAGQLDGAQGRASLDLAIKERNQWSESLRQIMGNLENEPASPARDGGIAALGRLLARRAPR